MSSSGKVLRSKPKPKPQKVSSAAPACSESCKIPANNGNEVKALTSKATSSSASGTIKKRSMSMTNRKSSTAKSSVTDTGVLRVNFEIRGKVQGVHFRKYTQSKATSFGLRGWCQNTNTSTVIGCMEGPPLKVEQMKQWLKTTGSPKSIITGADFRETMLGDYTQESGFKIVK